LEEGGRILGDAWNPSFPVRNKRRDLRDEMQKGCVSKVDFFGAWRFSPLVKRHKSSNAYHVGDGVLVEVDILLDEKMPLEFAHHVAETLQCCCGGLPEVDRAFIMFDYTTWGPTGNMAENFE
jgi:hypothetical protein